MGFGEITGRGTGCVRGEWEDLRVMIIANLRGGRGLAESELGEKGSRESRDTQNSPIRVASVVFGSRGKLDLGECQVVCVGSHGKSRRARWNGIFRSSVGMGIDRCA